jgi:hypothetical protein
MHRLIRRMLGMGPSPAEAHRAALKAIGRNMIDGMAQGIRDPRPLTAEEMEHLMAHAGAVAHRAFPALYDDEED